MNVVGIILAAIIVFVVVSLLFAGAVAQEREKMQNAANLQKIADSVRANERGNN